jgi:pimeloyl-ACP methyl ester carboxylesterase
LTQELWVSGTSTKYDLELLHHAASNDLSRPPLLFVHGVSHGAWCWDEFFLPYFANNGWDVYALSLRGHGKSQGREHLNSFGLDDYVEDVLNAIDHIGMKPVLLGHSMGGGISQQILRRTPERILAAGLLASMPPGFLQPGEQPTITMQEHGLVAISRLLQGETLTANEVLSLPFFGGRISLEQAQRYITLLQTESARVRDDIRKMTTEAGPVPVPLLVVGTRNDMLFGEASMLRTAKHYGVEAHIMDSSCHDLMLDLEWERCANTILDWLHTVVQ